MLQYNFNWKLLSAMAGVTFWNFYFRLFPGTIRSQQVVDFLTHLLRHVPGKVLVIWDKATTHRSKIVQRLCGQPERSVDAGVSARLCAGAESGGILVGLLEAS